ncbi:hypothetical protein [uncultured Clostridium sp.]|uniref:hypothetical protein n=1 Tax=uncultured Clostridium sp. TaxID=59620 RepID=UPI002638684A|nr:hypothetical protein [uncultured Clostridium sp.]
MEENKSKLIKFNVDDIKDIEKIFKKKGLRSFTDGINFLVAKEIEKDKLEEMEDTILKNVDKIFEARLDYFEKNLANRILKLNSSMAIEVGIYNLLLSGSMELDKEQMRKIRRIVIENIKENDNLFKYSMRD